MQVQRHEGPPSAWTLLRIAGVGGVAVALHPSGCPGPQQGDTQPAVVTLGDYVEGHGTSWAPVLVVVMMFSLRSSAHRGIGGIRGFSEPTRSAAVGGQVSNRSGRSAGPWDCPSHQELKAWPVMAS